MPTVPEPKPVRLDPPGPHVTATVTVFLGTEDATTLKPALFRFLLDNGAELHTPVTATAVEAIRKLLQESSHEHPDIPKIGE